MEKRVIFRDRQEVQAADLLNIGQYAADSLDHVVYDAVLPGRGWSDFVVLQSGPTEITVKPGRIYNAGSVYVSEADVPFDFLTDLPNTNKKWVAVVGWGAEVEVDTTPRDFLIDSVTGATEPAAVPMQRLRKANVGTVIGVEAPQPAKPVVEGENVIIAWVMIGPTGVESIALQDAARVPNTYVEKLRTDELFAWRSIIGPQIDSLRSDIAAIKGLLAQRGDSRFLETVAIDVARLKEALEMEDGYTAYDADRFLDTNESDVENVNFLARVEEGIRFSHEAANIQALQVFNPVNPDIAISNGLILPKYSEVQRFKVSPFFESLLISQYQYQSHEMVQRTMAKQRIRYGEEKTVCTNSSWWKSGKYDSTAGVFKRGDETWEVIKKEGSKHYRLRRFWVDTYEEMYWDCIVVRHIIDGQQIGQTFLNGADGWLTSIGLYFTAKGSTGNVHVALAMVKYGQPDLENLINVVTLDVANIQVSGDGTVETKVPFPPTFLEAGKRYAIVLTTGGNHSVAMAQGTQHAQGTFFYSVDGAYQQGTFDKDMMFSLYFANFAQVRTIVDLNPMSLAGGITDIDILAPMLVPESCDLQFEVQVAGVWYPLAEVVEGNTVLHGLPPLLPFRAVFNGTSDVQPAINTVGSEVSYSRPRTTFKHITTEYTLGVSTDTFKVVAIVENYKEANHDLTCTILADAAGAPIAAAAVVDEPMDPTGDERSPDHKRFRRIWTWTDTEITSPMESVVIIMDGTTTSALDTFHVAERVHLAF